MTIPSSGRLSVVSVNAETSLSKPLPMNAAPSATPAAAITQASRAAKRTTSKERIAAMTAAMRRSCAAAKGMSHHPGGVGTWLPFARKKPYQTSEPASQSVAAHAQQSSVGRRPAEARA